MAISETILNEHNYFKSSLYVFIMINKFVGNTLPSALTTLFQLVLLCVCHCTLKEQEAITQCLCQDATNSFKQRKYRRKFLGLKRKKYKSYNLWLTTKRKKKDISHWETPRSVEFIDRVIYVKSILGINVEIEPYSFYYLGG